MKRILLLSAFLVSTMFATESRAQVSFSLNIDTQPAWGPTGYDHVEYYYLPDIDAYYYVPRRQFIYMDGGRWIFANSLPPRYRNFDLYNSYKVVINDREPYKRNNVYRQKYITYRGRRNQAVIRNSREERYYVNPGNQQHNVWMSRQKRPTPAQQKVQRQKQTIQHQKAVIKNQRVRDVREKRVERREDAKERREDRHDGRK